MAEPLSPDPSLIRWALMVDGLTGERCTPPEPAQPGPSTLHHQSAPAIGRVTEAMMLDVFGDDNLVPHRPRRTPAHPGLSACRMVERQG